MLRFFKFLGGAAALLVGAYLLHIPALKYWTRPAPGSELTTYMPLDQGARGTSHEIARLYYGRTIGLFYNRDRDQYAAVVVLFDHQDEVYSEFHRVTLSAEGQVLETAPLRRDAMEAMFENPAYETMPRVSSAANAADRIELVHYQYERFTTWPYLYYFIPVIPSNWQGSGYFRVVAAGDEFKVRLPTDYEGGFLYAAGPVDGQLFLRHRPAPAGGLTFLEVSEGSYLRDMNGVETHRPGYGLYVIRKRPK